ncbi:MAG: hypothetical protein QUS13_00220, partial [Smithella sp.]|nr:hypothetical protein [Smithella sp.]
LPQLYLWQFTIDDSFISFRYVERLASGMGLTFNDGERVEGFSNPLWILLLAVLKLVISPQCAGTVVISKAAGFTFSLLTILYVWKISQTFSSTANKTALFLLSTFLIFLYPGYHVYATGGLEGPLFCFLITLGTYLSIRGTPQFSVLAGFVFGLAGITRPEGALYALLWYTITTIFAYKSSYRRLVAQERKSFLKHHIYKFVAWVLPIAIYEAFRYLYFGAYLPNTAIAKIPGIFGGNHGLVYLWQLGKTFIIPILLVSAIFWCMNHFLQDRYSDIIKKIKSTYSPEFTLFVFVSLGPIIANIIFLIYAQGDWMNFGRFYMPIIPLLSIMAGKLTLDFFYSFFSRKSGFVSYVLIMLFFAATFAHTWLFETRVYIERGGYCNLMKGTDQIVAGKWLSKSILPGCTVATIRLGGICYYAPNLTILDLAGLTNREEALYIRQHKSALLFKKKPENDPLLRRHPDVIAQTDLKKPSKTRFLKYLDENYILVKTFVQGMDGKMYIWINKNKTDKILQHKN